MNPKQKLTNLIGRILGVGELPSASELDLCLETATDNEIRRLFFALYRAEFLSLRELIEAFEREEKIEIIKEVYSSISKPEGSA